VQLTWDDGIYAWLPAPKVKGNGTFVIATTLPAATAEGKHELDAVLRAGGRLAQARGSVLASLSVMVTAPLAEGSTPAASTSPSPSPSATQTPASQPTAPAASPTPSASTAPTASPEPPGSPGPITAGAVVGYGRGTVGGAGGRTLTVTNLNDDGPGSLRAALESSGRRVVVFQVAGTIRLTETIKVKDPFLTVAGETAPAPGITVRGGALLVRAPEVILRHLRLRPGDQGAGPDDVDALTLNGADGAVHNVVVDHVTMLWGPDIGGLAVLGDVRDVSVQNSIMGEGLYLSAHSEGTLAEGGHSHAANVTQLDGNLAAPRRLTFWHNLFTTADSRIPRFQGAECVDLVNNVIYNWGTQSAHGNPRSLNLVNNWYRNGPETSGDLFWRMQTSVVAPTPFPDAVFLSGNVADGFSVDRDASAVAYATSVRCGGLSVPAEAAGDAYTAVLRSAGAIAPVRDVVDRRIIDNVVERTGRFFNGTGYPAPNPYWP
jgi:pectate lyase